MSELIARCAGRQSARIAPLALRARPPGVEHWAGAAALGLVVLVSACSGAPARCSETRLLPDAVDGLRTASGMLDFEPLRPCSFRSNFVVRRVFVDVLPGSTPQPRINFSVARDGQSAFILSETRAELPFTAIPQSTHRLTAVGSLASGFAGPGGSGQDIAYLRWRVGGVTHELSATLGPWLTERDVQAIAAALIELHSTAPMAGTAEPSASPDAQ